jgi:hypothetical protein
VTTRRIAFGDVLGDGSFFGGRAAAVGYDVLTEPLNSPNIPFDTRYGTLGNVVASGLITCNAGPIPFPDMGYIPVCAIYQYDGSHNLIPNGPRAFGAPVAHTWFPAIGIVSSNSIEVQAFQLPYYNTLAFYNPVGAQFAYYVFSD